jgi:hypothetical protein
MPTWRQRKGKLKSWSAKLEANTPSLMQISLYIDEDAMSRALLRGLRARGIEATTVLDEGKVGDSDQAQLEYAWQTKRVLYSFNVRDFCRLHKEYLADGKSHAGIVVVYRQRYSVGEQLRLLLRMADLKSAKDMINTLLFL